MNLTVHTDGGSRGNPGPAAIGIVILDDQENKTTFNKTIGITTNNVAEYKALHQAAQIIKEKYGTCEASVEYFLDSELVVKQLRGEYKVKNEELSKINQSIKDINKNFQSVKYTHILRELNKEADALVNEALDSQK